jgi:chromosome segregation ATPase
MGSAQNGGDIIMKSFMERVEQSVPSLECAFSTTTPIDFRGSFALRDRHNLSSTQIKRDWRSGVTELFMQNAQTSHDSMMRKIEDMCFDLEGRCHNVEGPLRAAEEERNRYANENERLKTQNTELEAKSRGLSDSFVELGQENTRLEQLLQGQCAYTDELTVLLESAREELQQQQQSSEKALLAEKEKARSKELEMMATLTEKDDQLEGLQQEMCGLQMKNEQIRQNLDQVSSEKATLSELSSSLKQELDSATETLKQTRLLANDREDEVNRLLAQEEEFRKELGSMETMVSFLALFNMN